MTTQEKIQKLKVVGADIQKSMYVTEFECAKMLAERFVEQPEAQATERVTDQFVDQLTDQSADQLTDQSADQLTEQSTEQSVEQVEATIMEKYLEEVTSFVRSLEFMRLGQAISHKQWQAAAMKANKLTKEIQRLGITGFERPMTGVRQNVNRKNGEEALQALSLIINKRVKMLEILGVAK